MIVALLVLHLGAAIVAPTLVRRFGSRAFAPVALAPAATAVWAATQLGAARDGEGYTERFAWVPDLGMDLVFRMDVLAWVLTLVVSGVGALVLLYCAHYVDSDGENNVALLAASLVGFAGAMLGLVTSDNLLLLYVFWEITTVLSYLLIGYLSTSQASTRAAKQALIVTTAGGLAMLVGIVMIGHTAGTYSLGEVVRHPITSPVVTAGIVLLLVGAISKSALIPFHFWLPGAMVAPTPISAYLHAAAMVKAGVYLVARLAPGYADLPAWQWIVLVLGGGTMLLGAFRATRQNDLKLLLAYGTVSQLGFLVLLLGYGSAGATLAGLTLVVAHALFKSSLFLTVGTIDHSVGTRDIRRLVGVRGHMPVLAIFATLSAMSMAGLPVLIGFVGKEAALGAVLHPVDGWWSLQGMAGVAVVLGSVLTMAYSTRFVWGAFTDGARPPTGKPTPPRWHKPTWVLVGIPSLLSLGGLVLGLTSTRLEGVLETHTTTVEHVADAHEVHLGLWHGVSLPLLVSIGIWALGLAWWWGQARRPVEVPVPLFPFDAGRTYHHIMRGVDRVALEVTGFMQRGSLPVLLGTIFTVVVVLPGLTLVTRQISWPDEVRWFDSPSQVLTGALVVLAAYLATRARRRLRAVFLVSVTGYGTALLFLLHGAPDLALTQLLVETVTLVVLVLVLRRLSGRFPDDPTRLTRRVRALLGISVGTMVGVLAALAAGSRVHEPAGVDLAERSVDYGGGSNIVNVILVDVRAWDTMGELSVVLATATGVASLIFLRDDNMQRATRGILRARSRWAGGRVEPDAEPVTPSGTSWIAGTDVLDPDRRSTILEIVTHLVFHTIMLWSVYLLFSGHNDPGGGFAAGIVAGLALCLRYLAGYGAELRAALPVRPAALLGSGLGIAAGSAALPMLLGSPPLRSWVTDLHIPLLGEVHVVTSLLFDLGVYLVVIGLMLDILRSFGSGIDDQIRDEREQQAEREEVRA
ncbi:Na+/H+ antiporter subunit A [Ornithinimicrobium humiphilum]|uniref:Multisubunit sodium/proton antiporter MrpA subunit /multisubunit sodium/proton antiporter MrpB subunit n=1 Tax=Ornithinimicrobium humiphilum TaxID=125288 RepID=A0A543K5D7_9MICO|nr:Na+/H+ antiporter subunit A [Ornithinimicrobium humiphilum]TQM90286.1 multisubunit sodium/proton antiporter MrpA subunit /multisubunit sodium/proton antiporter MrpB subunit [Ornithinimicrobium humiphilum]